MRRIIVFCRTLKLYSSPANNQIIPRQPFIGRESCSPVRYKVASPLQMDALPLHAAGDNAPARGRLISDNRIQAHPGSPIGRDDTVHVSRYRVLVDLPMAGTK